MPKSLNPAESGLTGAEYEVYNIVRARQAENETITTRYVSEEWGGKEMSWTWRVLRALMDKGMIEQYSGRFYRLAKHKPK